MASGNMNTRWNQQRLHGVCPTISPMNKAASVDPAAISQATNSHQEFQSSADLLDTLSSIV